MRKTVEDAASVGAGISLSYLFVLLYIAIAAGAVTYKALFLENPVKLPFLGVELPLVAFFFLAPILFIVLHAYTLVHFVMLAAKVGAFDTELREQLCDAPETREALRRQGRGGPARTLRVKAMALQRPLPDEMLRVVAAGAKTDATLPA